VPPFPLQYCGDGFCFFILINAEIMLSSPAKHRWPPQHCRGRIGWSAATSQLQGHARGKVPSKFYDIPIKAIKERERERERERVPSSRQTFTVQQLVIWSWDSGRWEQKINIEAACDKPGKATQLKEPTAIAPSASTLVGAKASKMSCTYIQVWQLSSGLSARSSKSKDKSGSEWLQTACKQASTPVHLPE